MSIWLRVLLVCAVALTARTARADDDDDDLLTADKLDPATCLEAPPPRPAEPTGGIAPPPVTWSDFEVVGTLVESPATVRSLYEPTLRRHRALTDDARSDIKRISAAYGYHLVGLGTKETPTGTHAVVHVAPLPLVRRVNVKVKQSIISIFTQPLLDDELRRRMRTRIGGYLPWAPHDRACERYDEVQRLEEYLRDEGFIDARVGITEQIDGSAVEMTIKVKLGSEYTTGIVNLAPREPDGVADREIQNLFRHSAGCVLGGLCFGDARFKRQQHQADVQAVVDLYRKRGYPAVRVRSDYDPLTSFDRRSHRVNFTLTIDQRRKIDVAFEGYQGIASDDDLRKQLTFGEAASADDVEAAESAQALAGFLQSRGYFDARVTWGRERFEYFDRIVFRIDAGQTRKLQQLTIVGNKSLPEDQLRQVLGTAEATRTSNLLGQTTSASSAQLVVDVDSLVELYRREGFREARVSVTAATLPTALDDPAFAAAMLLADRGGDLFVRYTVDEGTPTMLTQVEITLGPDGDRITTPELRRLCEVTLGELSTFYGVPDLAKVAVTDGYDDRCVTTTSALRFKEVLALETRERIRDKLYAEGRPRAKVTYEVIPLGPHKMLTRYKLVDIQPLTIGKVVVRGNFRTDRGIILQELGFTEGTKLTKDKLAEGARKLRQMGLFDAVNVALPDLDQTSGGEVNAVVEIAERHDVRMNLDIETGVSSYNGVFLRVIPGFKNLFGRGISLDLAGTIGFDVSDALDNERSLRQLSGEVTLKFPQYLSKRWISSDSFTLPDWLSFTTEVNAFHRIQDTERFGLITTDGATLTFAHTEQWARTATSDEKAITCGAHYDFRRRERPVDVLRPIGADEDETQVPISTRTGSVGFACEWEQRTNRDGLLQPLQPERGFRWEAQASLAAPYFLGQDTFIKLSASGSKYHLVGENLLLRADVRYDQGIPLAGAVLLPEVERYFAGGDSTVRGYEDDRLATEIIQVAVPPFDGASQLRILPAGGNIRALASLDAQVRIKGPLASALFVDAGMITNTWGSVDEDDIHPSVGIALIRLVTPFGIGALERAIPLNPNLGDNPRGRWHFSFAARAQF